MALIFSGKPIGRQFIFMKLVWYSTNCNSSSHKSFNIPRVSSYFIECLLYVKHCAYEYGNQDEKDNIICQRTILDSDFVFNKLMMCIKYNIVWTLSSRSFCRNIVHLI